MSISCTSKYKSTPTYTFKGRSKSVTSFNDPANLPSPHAYNPTKLSLRRSKQCGFPQAIRRQWQEVKVKRQLPSPGSYQPQQFLGEGPKITIKSKIVQKIFQTPSPTEYNANPLQILKKEPSYSIQKRSQSSADIFNMKYRNTPSPGQYQQPILKYNNSSAFQTISKSKRFSMDQSYANPGPGCYQAERSYASLTASSKCKLSKSARKIDFSFKDDTPGPGQYNSSSFIDLNKSKSRGYSCRSKFNVYDPHAKLPGPGEYQTFNLKKFKSSPLFKIPKQERFIFMDKNIRELSQSPSPGKYELNNSDKIKFRSQSIYKFKKYDTNYLKDVLRQQSSKLTGPGCYNSNPEVQLKRSPQYLISKAQRKGAIPKINNTPGPSEYNPKAQIIHQSQFTHKMQTAKRQNTIKHLLQNPGPGQYEVILNEKPGKQFKFSKQLRHTLGIKLGQKKQFHETYEARQSFPNPPHYMSVKAKFVS